MRRPSISLDNNPVANAIGCIAAIFIVPVLLVVKLALLPFAKPFNRSPEDVARYLRDFLEGTGKNQDWDDFISIPMADPQLDYIRQRAAALDLPLTPYRTAPLKALIAEAEALAAHDRPRPHLYTIH